MANQSQRGLPATQHPVSKRPLCSRNGENEPTRPQWKACLGSPRTYWGQVETGAAEHQLESTQGALTQVRTPLAWQELADWSGALTTASAVQTACESLPPFFLLLISCGDTCGPWVTSVLSM